MARNKSGYDCGGKFFPPVHAETLIDETWEAVMAAEPAELEGVLKEIERAGVKNQIVSYMLDGGVHAPREPVQMVSWCPLGSDHKRMYAQRHAVRRIANDRADSDGTVKSALYIGQ
ncbi:hypothetical protein [Sphingomonas sp. LT1P40]|uniref:hypothetical protein n=1 Tax=Alteristakelama amylovorans TaxID=3096166 RepID=UPI002FC63269